MRREGTREAAVQHRPGWVRVTVPATAANLGPGFDTLGVALDWTEEVLLRLGEGELRIAVSGPGEESVPRDGTNLVARGAMAVLNAAGRSDLGIEVRQRLRVPVGRGLGSSAAAVVAGLVAANYLLGEPLSTSELIELGTAIEGHADNVAPALLGGFCVACPGGEPPAGAVRAIRLPVPPGVAAVVAVPDEMLPTRVAREVLPGQVPFADAVANVQRACLLVAAVAAGRTDMLDEATRDRLHQPYRARLLPLLEEGLAAARRGGALGAFLSGAGPTLLALVSVGGAAEAAVQEAWRQLLIQQGGGTVRAVALSARGAVVQRVPAAGA